MEITWYGHSCFRLAERGKATIITDPFSDSIGMKLPALKGDVVTISHDVPGHNNYGAIKGWQRALSGPGEYEIGGVFIVGSALHNSTLNPPKRNVAFVFDYDGLTVAHLGDLDHVPPQSTIEEMGEVNIALVPVGGGAALNASQAAEVISLLEPGIVIPMHYKTEQNVLELDTAERFLKEMGVSRIQQENMLKITSSGLPDQMQIVVLGLTR
jgi:L-ascorbate metabolism protein UlaG (beta-lactamase superfamily)